ncbi:MAG: prephenate dehydratase [Alphaproteobacteria bacterium]
MTKPSPEHLIAFQGEPGANSDLACRAAFPDLATLPCASFEDTFAAVREGRAGRAMIPIDNSVAGRVADIHHLLPASGLHITAEHFHRISHCLVAPPGRSLRDVQRVYSHVHALGQCRRFIAEHGLQPVVHSDTAGAARMVAASGEAGAAAIATELAAEIYGLEVLARDIEDAAHNTTRFVIMQAAADWPAAGSGDMVTTLVFQVRSVPAALYKALGGFATNGVNITKLESYIIDGAFTVAQFYADLEGHPDDQAMQHAFEELDFFTASRSILGVYPASPFRRHGHDGPA